MADRPQHRVALAPNWRRVVAVDALVGIVLFAAGVVLMVAWSLVIGAFIAAAGCTYLVLVGRRYVEWQRIRRDSALAA